MAIIDKIRLSGTTYDIVDQSAQTAIGTLQTGKADKSEIPTNVSDLTNDSGFQTAAQVTATVTAATDALASTIATTLQDYATTANTYTKSQVDGMIPDVSTYFDAVDYDSQTKRINFSHGNTVLDYIDATAFVKDGMVDTVGISAVTSGASTVQCLVITFNTDAGKQDINIPLSGIFDASNYYTTAQTQSYVSGYTYDKTTIDQKISDSGTFDPTQYYTKSQVDALIPTVPTTVSSFTNDAHYAYMSLDGNTLVFNT